MQQPIGNRSKSDLFQARTQQLLQQNRELLEHIAALGGYHEPDRPNLTATSIGMAAPQVRKLNPQLAVHN